LLVGRPDIDLQAIHKMNFIFGEKLMDRSVHSRADVVAAEGEVPFFSAGDPIVIAKRFPIGHFRVPNFIRGKSGLVEAVIPRLGIDNEEEGFGRNAGNKRHYYRISIPMTELWPDYSGSAQDGLRIEVFESWLKRRSANE
jgi:nitrile hydratase subunit beta